MIRHNYLVNPIEQTRVMRPEEFEKYIALRDEQAKTGITTDKTVVDQIRDAYFSTHWHSLKPELTRVWQFVQPMVEQNTALAQFILDYGGAESDFFFPWLVSVATSPSAALEMAYGAGYNTNGDWYGSISDSDNIADFIHNVPTFVYQRERQLFMADLVSSIKDNCKPWLYSKIADLGAGQLAWFRYHGFKPDSDTQEILAVDKDPAIHPEELFAEYGDNYEAITGVKYERQDILPWLAQPTMNNVSLVMIGGVASYFPLPAFTEAVIKPVHRILDDKGSFFFDLQLDCLQYEWTIKLFGWPEMHLAKSAEEAIANVEKIRRSLWDARLKFSAEYHVDTPNANPSAVMVVFQKL